MVLPFTKSQIERLGRRLVEQTPPAQPDLDDLAALLSAYDEVLAAASAKVRDLGHAPTGRLKNTGTILEKLRRHGGSWLKTIQDLAGLRIVIEGGLREQDRAAEEVRRSFTECPKAPKLIDRRADPRQGYRAVHVIVFPQGVPVEVQVRTRRQHTWAELFEKLADQMGREIRYGEPWLFPGEQMLQRIRQEFQGQDPGLDAAIAEGVESIAEARRQLEKLVDQLLQLSEHLSGLEQIADDPSVDALALGKASHAYEGAVHALQPKIEEVEAHFARLVPMHARLEATTDELRPVRSNHD
ncbi:RelA/SpoT domain-containing protein [Streptomyces sp. NPDC055808]